VSEIYTPEVCTHQMLAFNQGLDASLDAFGVIQVNHDFFFHVSASVVSLTILTIGGERLFKARGLSPVRSLHHQSLPDVGST